MKVTKTGGNIHLDKTCPVKLGWHCGLFASLLSCWESRMLHKNLQQKSQKKRARNKFQDWSFHKFTGSKSVDRGILWNSKLSIQVLILQMFRPDWRSYGQWNNLRIYASLTCMMYEHWTLSQYEIIEIIENLFGGEGRWIVRWKKVSCLKEMVQFEHLLRFYGHSSSLLFWSYLRWPEIHSWHPSKHREIRFILKKKRTGLLSFFLLKILKENLLAIL